MARIRTIKPEFWTNEQVMDCSPITRLLFIGLWNFCDDRGRHELSPKKIKAEIFPSDDISADDVRRMVDELSEKGLIETYEVDGKGYFAVTGWKHQKIDKPQEPRCPAPQSDHSSNVRRMVATERKGEERKGEESNNISASESVPPARASSLETEFREAVVDVYLSAGAVIPPDTGHCAVWLAQGYSPELCLSVIRSRMPSAREKGLKWFDKAIAEASTVKAQKGQPPPDGRKRVDVGGGVLMPEENLRREVDKWREDPRSWDNPVVTPPDRNLRIQRWLAGIGEPLRQVEAVGATE